MAWCDPWTYCVEKVGLFAVWKIRNQSQRLIVDARRANARFRAPPGVDLLTAEALSRIEVEGPGVSDNYRICVGTADVKDCFHRMRIPEWLSRYFALPPVPAKTLGLEGTVWNGRLLTPMSPVSPGWAVLPMGFSWSLFFAQAASASRAAQSVGVAPGAGLSDRGPVLVIRPRASPLLEHYMYVENLGCICSDESVATGVVGRWVESFEQKNLLLHKSEVRTGPVEVLATKLNWQALAMELTDARFARVQAAAGGLLDRRKVTGWSLEVVVGHLTFCGLANRALFSVLNTVYALIRRHYLEAVPLWHECRAELRVFAALLFLARADWTLPGVFGAGFA